MKKGWLGSKSLSTTSGTVSSNGRLKEKNGAVPTTTTAKEDVTAYRNGVTIEEITEEDNNDDGDNDEEVAIEDLKTVFDSSTAIPKHTKTARNNWLRTTSSSHPEFRWTQTSTDISTWVTLPLGTRAKELSVTITPTSLSVSLGWYGTLLTGEMHQRLKSSECQWCLEDNELHLILVKDSKDTWWKTLFSDGGGDNSGDNNGSTSTSTPTGTTSISSRRRHEQERSYHELLKEAVEADEPVVPYDEMSDEAKELLERLLDRQAMVNQGYIDIEIGFDDFRVVIGEKSLGGGGGGSGGENL